jgi:glycosyltransferase involved in cell wall biosynthesis
MATLPKPASDLRRIQLENERFPMRGESSCLRFFVPRWMDRANLNAQNSNARSLLSRFSDARGEWIAISGSQPAESVRDNDLVKIRAISNSRFWQFELALAYQSKFDAVFYPGPHWGDEIGLQFRKISGRRNTVISTIEGIIASPASLRRLSTLTGHLVFSQPGTASVIPRIRWLYDSSDYIIAISPFLERVAKALYGDKVFYLPLGIESGIFHARGRREPECVRVVGCGTVKNSKNPEIFLQMAARYKNAEFVWFGDGAMRHSLILKVAQMHLGNVSFPGSLRPESLAEEFRKSSLFVLPSHAEGVPKVTQEAAACGLPIVVQGFYETPTVENKINGLVAWSDEELIQHVGTLINSPEARESMGKRSVEVSQAWNWDHIASKWEELLIRLASP